MKIAVFGINYYPEVTGIGLYTTEMCEYLAAKGHEIHAITGFPYYPFGHDYSAWYKNKGLRGVLPFCHDDMRGVKIKRCNLYKPDLPNTLKRIFHELSFIFSVSLRSFFDFGKYDVVISVSPPLLLGFTANVFARIKKAHFILHVQDMQPDAAIELGMIRNKALISLLLGMEKSLYERADHVMTISDAMRHKIVKKGISDKKVGLLFNWADTASIIPLARKNSFSKRHYLDGKFVVLHAGNMGEKQDMHIVMEAAAAMRQDPSVIFLLAGGGVKRSYVEHYVKKHGLTNIILLHAQEKGTFNEMLSACDAALITQRKGVGDCVMPSKICGPACAERPMIIATDEHCEIAWLAKTHNFAIVVPSGNSAELVASIYRLKEDRNFAEDLGRNARHFMMRDRSMDAILEKFEKELKCIER